MFSGLDGFAMLAIPFFVLAGTFMNSGSIARRLINFADVLVGRVLGSLWHVNVLSNALFGSISAIVACAAMGKTLASMQQ